MTIDSWLVVIISACLVIWIVAAVIMIMLRSRQVRALGAELNRANRRLAAWDLACIVFPAFTIYRDQRGMWLCVMDGEGNVLTKANQIDAESCILQADAQLRKDGWPKTKIVSGQATMIGVGGARHGPTVEKTDAEDQEEVPGSDE